MKLSVVVPFVNEAENLPRIETELLPVLEGLGVEYEILAIDDGSTDGSDAVVRGLKSAVPKLRLVRHPENRGLGAALRTGIAEAAGDSIVTFEADFTCTPVQIAKLVIRQLETGADCVAGVTLGSDRAAEWPRRLGSAVFDRFYRLWAGPYRAWTPLFRLYKASAVKDLPIESDGFEVNPEILLKLARAGKKVVEVSVELDRRKRGASKARFLRDLGAHASLALRQLLS